MFIVGFIYAMTPPIQHKKSALMLSLATVVFSISIWFFMRDPIAITTDETLAEKPTEQMSSLMEELQAKLTQDPNQGELWFQLGHGYVVENDFKSALTCFDYAIRLSDNPTASQYAAKATALYYVKSQRMTENVIALLDASLALDPQNQTALMLIANDHSISFRYQAAIDTWTRILDSERQEIDRVKLIQLINRAKERL